MHGITPTKKKSCPASGSASKKYEYNHRINTSFEAMVEEIIYENRLMAIIIRGNYHEKGIHFFTPPDFSQQLAYMHHPAGKLIEPHIHNPVPREVHYTKEVLVIRKGKLQVDFYTENQQYIISRFLNEGDIILLSEGGHGFEVIEEVEMYEIKQGPYAGELDKIRFNRKINC